MESDWIQRKLCCKWCHSLFVTLFLIDNPKLRSYMAFGGEKNWKKGTDCPWFQISDNQRKTISKCELWTGYQLIWIRFLAYGFSFCYVIWWQRIKSLHFFLVFFFYWRKTRNHYPRNTQRTSTLNLVFGIIFFCVQSTFWCFISFDKEITWEKMMLRISLSDVKSV